MIGAAGIRDRQGREGVLFCRTDQILERSKPRSEDRAHFFVALHVDAADLAGPVVEIKVARNPVVLWFQLELRSRLRRRWRLRACPGRTTAKTRLWSKSFAKVFGYISARSKQAFFFAAPQTDSNGSTRLQPESLKYAHGFHAHRRPGGVIRGAGS